MSFAFVPLRRLGIQSVVAGGVVGACGLAESWRSSLALIVLAVSVPFGVWADRPKRQGFAYPLEAHLSGLSMAEGPGRTALRTMNAMGPFAVFVAIGAFLPLIGSVAGGMAAGIAVSRGVSLCTLMRAEKRHDSRVIVQTPVKVMIRNKGWTPVYYRDRL